jgi:hypothetical protein
MIARSEAPPIAAAVASPERNECPLYFEESRPINPAYRFTRKATT